MTLELTSEQIAEGLMREFSTKLYEELDKPREQATKDLAAKLAESLLAQTSKNTGFSIAREDRQGVLEELAEKTTPIIKKMFEDYDKGIKQVCDKYKVPEDDRKMGADAAEKWLKKNKGVHLDLVACDAAFNKDNSTGIINSIKELYNYIKELMGFEKDKNVKEQMSETTKFADKIMQEKREKAEDRGAQR